MIQKTKKTGMYENRMSLFFLYIILLRIKIQKQQIM